MKTKTKKKAKFEEVVSLPPKQALALQQALSFSNDSKQDLHFGLGYLATIQAVTSSMVKDCIPAEGSEPTKDQMRTYFMALTVELMELLQELNWKPWKEERVIDKIRVADEFADILAFLGIIIVYLGRLGITPSMLATAYAVKTEVNVKRFLGEVENYRVSKKE